MNLNPALVLAILTDMYQQVLQAHDQLRQAHERIAELEATNDREGGQD